MGKLRVYCLKALNKLSIYPLGNTPSAPSVSALANSLKKAISSVSTEVMSLSMMVSVLIRPVMDVFGVEEEEAWLLLLT